MESTKTDRSDIHKRVRQQHSSELAYDYVEAIHEIREEGRVVKVSALQEVFGVSHVTVIRALKRLHGQELITDTKSKHIELTTEGRNMALKASEKHALVRQLLITLGVSDAQADADAEGVEHHLSTESISAISQFLKASKPSHSAP